MNQFPSEDWCSAFFRLLLVKVLGKMKILHSSTLFQNFKSTYSLVNFTLWVLCKLFNNNVLGLTMPSNISIFSQSRPSEPTITRRTSPKDK